MKELKNNSFILSIILLPVVMLLSVLRIEGVLKDNISKYLLIILGMIFVVIFIISLFLVIDDILNSNNKKRLIFLMIFPMIYLPIYCFKYIWKTESLNGYMVSMINLILIIGLFFSFNGYVNSYVVTNYNKHFAVLSTYNYQSSNLSLTVNKDYTCQTSGKNITCENIADDKKLNIYDYSGKEYTSLELKEILMYHINGILEPLKAKNIFYEIEYYNGMYIIYYENSAIMIQQDYKNLKCVVLMETVHKSNKDVFAFQDYLQKLNYLF